jgi:hypothetical protein
MDTKAMQDGMVRLLRIIDPEAAVNLQSEYETLNRTWESGFINGAAVSTIVGLVIGALIASVVFFSLA